MTDEICDNYVMKPITGGFAPTGLYVSHGQVDDFMCVNCGHSMAEHQLNEWLGVVASPEDSEPTEG